MRGMRKDALYKVLLVPNYIPIALAMNVHVLDVIHNTPAWILSTPKRLGSYENTSMSIPLDPCTKYGDGTTAMRTFQRL